MLGLLILLYAPLLFHWTHGWLKKSISIEHDYFSHALIGLPYAAYVIWQNRETWSTLPGGTGAYGGVDRWAGLGVILLSAVLYVSGLPEAINQGLYLTPRLTREQLRLAVEEPALVSGCDIDAGLVSRQYWKASDHLAFWAKVIPTIAIDAQ